MEVDVSVKLRELKTLARTKHLNNNLSAIANQLDSIGSDHIPAINLRSGRQMKDILLNYATDLINDVRVGLHFTPDKINLTERVLETTKHLSDDDVYLMKKPLQNHLSNSPLDSQQLNRYLKRNIDCLRN